MASIEINDLSAPVEISEEDLKHVKGGSTFSNSMQKVKTALGDGSVRTVLGDGSVRFLGDGSV